MLRSLATAGLLVLYLPGCSSAEPTGEASGQMSEATVAVSQAEMIQRAEAAVKEDLPDAPIWEGMTFAGSVVDESTLCVDRTWRDGGGVDGKGGSAGYVLVTFPALTLGEPTEGVCSDVSDAPEEEVAPPVKVPENVKDEPGLVTRTDMGKEWPLTVDYGLVACENKTAGGRDLQIATFKGPDSTVYALNGTAKDHTDAADIDPIWSPDPAAEGTKIGIGPLIERALAFC